MVAAPHDPMTRRRSLQISTVLLFPSLSLRLSAETLTPEERKKGMELLDDYRKAEVNPRRRREVIDQVIDQARPIRQGVLSVVEQDFQKALPAYKQAFKQASDGILLQRETKETREKIKMMRADVLALQKLDDAALKSKVHTIGDPARAFLREHYSISRDMVFQKTPALKPEREKLLVLADCRAQLRHALAVNDGRDYGSARLEQEEAALIGRAPTFDKEILRIMEGNQKLAAQVPAEEAEGVRLTNELRAMLGLTALVLDPRLCEAARGHSKDMAERGFFAHESPVPGKKTPWDRARLAGTSASAENIFAGSPKPQAAIDAWWGSPGHHRNMLNPGHHRMGMGVHAGRWTQMFG